MMISQRNNLILFISLCCILYSCSITVHDDLLLQKSNYAVANCIFQNDKPFSIQISKSAALNDSSIEIVSNAKVELFSNSVKIANLIFDAASGCYSSTKSPEVGIVYQIKVTMPDGLILNAQDSLPAEPKISSYPIFQASTWYHELNGMCGQVEISILDNKNTIDYYEVEAGIVSKINDDINYIDNVNSSWYQETILFSDQKINGKEYRMVIQIDGNAAPKVIVRKISAAYYNYKKSLYSYQNTQNNDGEWNPFPKNPSILKGNIINGLGIFAGYNESVYQSISQ